MITNTRDTGGIVPSRSDDGCRAPGTPKAGVRAAAAHPRKRTPSPRSAPRAARSFFVIRPNGSSRTPPPLQLPGRRRLAVDESEGLEDPVSWSRGWCAHRAPRPPPARPSPSAAARTCPSIRGRRHSCRPRAPSEPDQFRDRRTARSSSSAIACQAAACLSERRTGPFRKVGGAGRAVTGEEAPRQPPPAPASWVDPRRPARRASRRRARTALLGRAGVGGAGRPADDQPSPGSSRRSHVVDRLALPSARRRPRVRPAARPGSAGPSSAISLAITSHPALGLRRR